MNLKPLRDRVVIKAMEAEEVTKSGIVIPDTAKKERPQEGEVVAVGPGRLDDSGKVIPVAVKVGDKVIYSKYGGVEVKVDDQDYLIMREDDILAVVS
jgi:chaperonin GroES